MKKQKLKNLFKIGILIFGVSLLLWNCENEETVEHSHELVETGASRFKRASITDLLKSDETFSELSENYLSNKINGEGVSEKNTSSDLIITSDTINVIEKENYKSYTIRIKRENKLYDTENLIIEEKDGEQNAYILSYDLENDWMINHIKGIHAKPKGKVYYSRYETSTLKSRTSSSKSSGSCFFVTITITSPCGCGHYWLSECNGCSYGNQYPTTFSTTQLVCDSGGDNDNDGGVDLFPTDGGNEGGIGGSGGGGGGGNPSPSDSNNTSETQMGLEDMSEFVEFKINKLITRLELDGAQAIWLGEHIQEALEIYAFVAKENLWYSEAIAFAKAAVEALMNGGEVDFDEAYIYTDTPDDNYVYQGTKSLISNPLVLANGDEISITFGTTSDNINANQPVSIDLIDGLKFALLQVNQNLSASEQITSIHIHATTNGHNPEDNPLSNHLKATALDISRINGQKMILTGITNQIIKLQEAFDNFQYIRENFGPHFRHKYDINTNIWDYNKTGVGAHKDHIHIAVRR